VCLCVTIRKIMGWLIILNSPLLKYGLLCDDGVRVRLWCVASTKMDNGAWLFLGK
jgi:hypothetical protein